MIEFNLVGVLVATAIGMFLGALWYSPIFFGNAWMKSIGKTTETLGSAAGPMIGSVVACLLTAIGVALLFSMFGVNDLAMAMRLGLILGLLIIFPALLSDNLFCGWGNQLLMIQAGYRAVSIFLMCLAIYFISYKF